MGQRHDGRTFPVMVTASPVYDEAGGYIGSIAVQTDVTRQRQAEEQVRALNANLEQRVLERTTQLDQARQEAETGQPGQERVPLPHEP